MNLTKQMKVLSIFCLVVAVSFAAGVKFKANGENGQAAGFDQALQVPASYSKFANSMRAIQTDFTVAAELSVHAVVNVKTKIAPRQMSYSRDPFFDYFFGQPQMQQPREMPMQEAAGSGVIISTDGYIVTNNHVIDNSAEIEVTLNDKRTFKAKLVGADPSSDIALLKVEAEKLPVIMFGNSDSLKIGEWVLAVGNPFNLSSTVTAGIVSAKARNINLLNADMKIESFIQTDAAVNPGNSGGALVNTRGELVGINTAIASQTGSYAGYSFAVPVSIVQKVVADLRQHGVVQRAVLGVQISDINDQLAKDKDLKTRDGAYVSKIENESAAKTAGMKEGDIITKVNGVAVKTVSELQEQIGRYRPGEKITVDVLRNNSTVVLNVELKNRQGNTGLVSSQKANELLGAKFKEVNEKTKQQFHLEYGIEIESLTKGKLAEQGVKPGFIILKINNQAIKKIDDVQTAVDAAVNNGQQEKVLFITGVYSSGKIVYYAVNLVD